ncbi:MAG: winged helix-turn-helix domain-containing protein [Thermoplasmata archaeon]|uniref:Winged helix-turn-helix domain-containing protein n=1 Tax=Candidatus Sysuiplasma superficiale TaxID=2823368 RepID=A0A8J8CHS3_9ARCH|nr:winged helix-turn-helix transcriptional regulator [Candidatus Sysuiplasma superficiale]MBX8644228.1 winged helix-turn-helix domain-containing protein [Candidatus Sysuiplasma superficiale]MCL4346370.1 winged helix-turn-helix domain-containing protein [Candidatus Thermoplasmatota archaeon]
MVKIESTKELLGIMKVLSNPVRLRIIASLERKPKHIYALAKELKLSYPLVHLYLESLEKAGLVTSSTESGVEDERERKIYTVSPFNLNITPELVRKLEEAD